MGWSGDSKYCERIPYLHLFMHNFGSSLHFWAKITFPHFFGLWPSFLWKIVIINQAKTRTTTQVMAVYRIYRQLE